MRPMEDDIRRYQLWLSAIFLVACIGYLIAVYYLGIETEVMRDRYWKDVVPFLEGVAPIMEYPPFSLLFMVIPGLFVSTPFGYNIAYVGEVFVFMVIGLILTSKIAENRGYDQKRAMLAYSVLMLLMLEFVLDRFDIFPAVICLAAIYCFLRKWYVASFALVAVGTLTKIYPALLFPVFLIALLADRDCRGALRGTVSLVVVALAIMLPIMIIEPEMITGFLGYHTDRPLQIESVAASILYPFGMAGLMDMSITSAKDPSSFGSDNLVGPIPDAVAGALMPLMIVAILAVYFLFLYIRAKGVRDDSLFLLASASLLSVLMFIVVGKVFSSQYMIWIIPPLLFTMMSCPDRRLSVRLFWLTVVALILTQAEFAYNVGYLGGGPNIDDAGMILVLVRNIVVIAFSVLIVRGVWDVFRRYGAREADAPAISQ